MSEMIKQATIATVDVGNTTAMVNANGNGLASTAFKVGSGGVLLLTADGVCRRHDVPEREGAASTS